MIHQLKVFTPEEANKFLPELTRLIEKLQEARHQIMVKEAAVDALELVAPEEEEKASAILQADIDQLNDAIESFNGIIERIHRCGCFLKDVDMGLLDFYTLLEGRVVYLCWKYGEAEVAHWHEVGEGYALRQVLPPHGT